MKCKELDAALTALENMLATDMNDERAAVFGRGPKLDRALLRVRSAAAKFGPEHQSVARAWTSRVRSNGWANPAALLEDQVALFGECLVDEDGSPDRCLVLQESLEALQVALNVRGKVVSTAQFRGSALVEEAAADTATSDTVTTDMTAADTAVADEAADDSGTTEDDDTPPPEGFEWGITL